MDLSIPYQKVSTVEEAYEVVRDNITPEEVAKYKVKAKFSYDESNRVIEAKGTGFGLVISFHEQEANVDLELSFLLKAMKGKVLKSLEKSIKRYI